MKNLKLYLSISCFLFCSATFAQLEIDHPLQLTGSGADAKVSGIQSITDAQDAVSAQSVQKGGLVYSQATGNSNNFSVTLSPPITSYVKGMVINFISNQNVNGPATLNVNNLGAVPIKKNINQNLSGCEIQNGQFVTVGYDSVNFQMLSIFSGVAPTAANAGPDSFNIPTTTFTLSANTPTSGTGGWTIDSGSGGSFSNHLSPTSTFTGVQGNAYVLSWAIATSCSTSIDTVRISFKPTQTFNYTGSQQMFTVPQGVTQVTIAVYGAQGGTVSTNIGGEGGSATGTLGVYQGQILYINVGGQPNSTSGGFNGGGAGYGNGNGGGGASDVRAGGTGLANRVIVAGGGGGAPYISWTSTGGTGGGTNGGNGLGGAGGTGSGYDGQGGTQNAGGYGSTTYGEEYSDQGNSVGQGGSAGTENSGNGGGGGGYYGGGGGDAGPGGGGSGYTGGVTNASMQNGVQSGNGQVILTW